MFTFSTYLIQLVIQNDNTCCLLSDAKMKMKIGLFESKDALGRVIFA